MADDLVTGTLLGITAVSVDNGTLEAREHMLARLAALASVGAPTSSYLLNFGTAAEVGVTLEDVEGVLVAIAPIIGTAQTLRASENIAEAFGWVVAEIEAEIEEELLVDALVEEMVAEAIAEEIAEEVLAEELAEEDAEDDAEDEAEEEAEEAAAEAGADDAGEAAAEEGDASASR